MGIKNFILFILLFCAFKINATTIASTQCGNWSDTSIWNLGRVPLNTDTVIISDYVLLDVDYSNVSPGYLNVEDCGTICGYHHITGRFTNRGVIKVDWITCSYGISNNYGTLNAYTQMDLFNAGSNFYNTPPGGTCVGCLPGCLNCSQVNLRVNCASGLAAIKSETIKLITSEGNNITIINNNASGKVVVQVIDVLGNTQQYSELLMINGTANFKLSVTPSEIYFVRIYFEEGHVAKMFKVFKN